MASPPKIVPAVIGDALARPNEGPWPSAARERRIRDYQPWHGWQSGPKGTITDDTQMTMCLAESILAVSRRALDAGEHHTDSRRLPSRGEGERVDNAAPARDHSGAKPSGRRVRRDVAAFVTLRPTLERRGTRRFFGVKADPSSRGKEKAIRPRSPHFGTCFSVASLSSIRILNGSEGSE